MRNAKNAAELNFAFRRLINSRLAATSDQLAKPVYRESLRGKTSRGWVNAATYYVASSRPSDNSWFSGPYIFIKAKLYSQSLKEGGGE